MFRMSCPNLTCRGKLTFRAESLGKLAPCPRCGTVVSLEPDPRETRHLDTDRGDSGMGEAFIHVSDCLSVYGR